MQNFIDGKDALAGKDANHLLDVKYPKITPGALEDELRQINEAALKFKVKSSEISPVAAARLRETFLMVPFDPRALQRPIHASEDGLTAPWAEQNYEGNDLFQNIFISPWCSPAVVKTLIHNLSFFGGSCFCIHDALPQSVQGDLQEDPGCGLKYGQRANFLTMKFVQLIQGMGGVVIPWDSLINKSCAWVGLHKDHPSARYTDGTFAANGYAYCRESSDQYRTAIARFGQILGM
mgnify:FL=1